MSGFRAFAACAALVQLFVARALPDCSAAACPSKCSCGEQRCASQIESCLADSTCATSQACVQACPCGDLSCLVACAEKNPTAKGLSVLACFKANCNDKNATAPAVALPDCSTTACPAKCQCGEQKCAKEIADCLADTTCASAQACAEACPCGDDSCLAGCALKHPTAKGLAALKCLKANCPSAAVPAFALPDCSATACPAKCQCGEQKCAKEITDCLADTACASGQACAEACPCGDHSCLAGCALKHPTAKGLAALKCFKANCDSKTTSVAAIALPDCSATACPAKCQCGEQKCAKEITDCLADTACASGQACAEACPCGDDSCLAGCALKHPTAKGLAALKCLKANCPSAAVAAFALPDCSATACPAKCQCGERKCATEIGDCLADTTCASGQACAQACPCGDDSCLAGCAMKHPTAKGLAALKCFKANCDNTNATAGAAALPDCSKTACPAKCQCGEQKCAKEITDCLADTTCASAQACAEACPCGDDSCLAGCALKHPTAKGLVALKCLKANCPSSAVAAVALPDCSATVCPAKCQCGEQKCAKEITDCLADTTCASGQACAEACPCGDDSCLAGCALKHPTAKGLAALKCLKANCKTAEETAIVV